MEISELKADTIEDRATKCESAEEEVQMNWVDSNPNSVEPLFPMLPGLAIQRFKECLTEYEEAEIMEY